jgi:hypothetical protein
MLVPDTGYWPQEKYAQIYAVFLCTEVITLFVLLSSKINNSLGGGAKFWPSFNLPWNSPLFLSQLMQLVAAIVFYVLCIKGLYVPSTEPEWKCNAMFKAASMMFVFNCFFMYLFLLEKAKVVQVASSAKFNLFHQGIKLITLGLPGFIALVGYLNSGIFMFDSEANVTVCFVTVLPVTAIIVALLDMSLNIGFFILFYIPLRAVIKARIASGNPDDKHDLEVTARRNFETTVFSVVGNLTAMITITIGNLSGHTSTLIILSVLCGFSVKMNTLALLYVTKNAWDIPCFNVQSTESRIRVKSDMAGSAGSTDDKGKTSPRAGNSEQQLVTTQV